MADADERLRPGTHPLSLAHGRDGLLFVPKRAGPASVPASPGAVWPLIVLLHGAGADAADILPALRRDAERTGCLVVAPDSRDTSWDLLEGTLGPDVAFIDRALASIFRRFVVDPAHLALAGFSDGASYALSLGLANGDLFSHLVALSPGFLSPPAERGRPRIFVAHGRRDRVLPIDRCGRRIVPMLERAGYAVTYVEFEGGHAVPRPVVGRALDWMLAHGAEDAPDRSTWRDGCTRDEPCR